MPDLQEAWMGGVKQMAMALPPEVRCVCCAAP